MLVIIATNIHTTIILTNCNRVAPPLLSPAVGAPIIPDVVVPCIDSGSVRFSDTNIVSQNNSARWPPVPFDLMDQGPRSFCPTTDGQYRIVKTNTPSAGGARSDISKEDVDVQAINERLPRLKPTAHGLSPVITNEVACGRFRISDSSDHLVASALANSTSPPGPGMKWMKRRGRRAVDSRMRLTEPFQEDMIASCMEREDELLEHIVEQGLRKFSSSELEAATHHFSMENMVGSGAFATVYKGVLHDGLVVAVKKFQHPYVLSAENLDKLHLISNLKHKNIVKLIGYSCEVIWNEKLFENAKVEDKEDKETPYLLVEEYMPNGSLDKAINGLQLHWSSHFHLIQGIAHGLCYLQEKGIVHMDVKPSNILLDSDMNSKITDFGTARVLNRTGGDICSNVAIAGTLGYMPPEYITNGTLSKKHDVYGFGVTLLEIISGLSRSGRASGQASIKWAWEARQAGGIMQQLDASWFDTPQLKEIERCIDVGLLCTQFEPADRPDILDALKMLCGEKALRTPVRPVYTYTSEEPVSWLRRWLGR